MEKKSALTRQVAGNHYLGKIQPVQYAESWGFGYCESLVLKYVTRHCRGGEGRQDIEKAIHALELLLNEKYQGVTNEDRNFNEQNSNGEDSGT